MSESKRETGQVLEDADTTRLQRPANTEFTADSRPDSEGNPPTYPPRDSTPKPAPAAPDSLIGATIDNRYVIEKRLARGGMATVYRARDTRLDRRVALKMMYPHLAESADFLARFRREARAAAKLTNPGVVAVYDQGSSNGSSYLVMELVNGPNLRTYLRSKGCLTVENALDITKQILTALAAAHRCGLVHRDIKPENVLLPENAPVKVADFGLARAASEVTAATTGSILGTVAYLAPETVSGESADSRVDVYATGIMLYELLAGTPPFRGDTPIQIAYAHVHEDVPRIRDSHPWVPQPVDTLIATLTRRDPAARPLDGAAALELVTQTLNELSESEKQLKGDTPPADNTSLEAFQVMTPTLNEVPLPRKSQTKFSGFFSRRKSKEPQPQVAPENTPTPEKPRRNKKVIILVSALGCVLALFLVWFFLWGPGSFRPMPDVVSQQWADASKTLTRNDIAFARVDVFDDNVPRGNVVRTYPAPNDPLGRFQTAKIYISKGIEMLTVPDLAGKNASDAAALVKKARFAPPKVSEDFSDSVAAGILISQDPAPKTRVRHNTIIEIVISKGREPVIVPNVLNKLRDEAATILSQAGLQPEVSEDFSDTVPKGKVISQNVAPNTTLYRNDKVSVVVSRGPRFLPMPNLVAKKQAEATAILQEMGMQVNVIKVYNLTGIVAETNPPAGTKVEVGSTVTIKVI